MHTHPCTYIIMYTFVPLPKSSKPAFIFQSTMLLPLSPPPFLHPYIPYVDGNMASFPGSPQFRGSESLGMHMRLLVVHIHLHMYTFAPPPHPTKVFQTSFYIPFQPLYSIPQYQLLSVGNPPPQHTHPPHSHPFVVRHSGTAAISFHLASLKVMMSHK